MKITSIKQQVKNAERVSVFIDGKYSFSLSLDELINQKLKNDMQLNPAQIKQLKKISADGKLRQRALEWVMNRPHSIREFKDYMYRKKAEPDLTEKLISEFSDKKYLDDEKFAAWFIELQVRRTKSNRAIRAELFKKGISGEVADSAMESQAVSEESRLKTLVAKKSQLLKYKKNPPKLAKYLTSQGFSYNDVRSELEKMDLYP